MYKLLNKLFGWDYIYWDYNIVQGISRVRVSPDGIVWYWRYNLTSVIDKITNPKDVLWLTCKSSKYFPNETT